jgi:MiaB/RimO family radical SAM methylthiotransferase
MEDKQSSMSAGVVHICSLGCVENQLEGARMEHFFLANGWRVTENPSQADLILVNSCGYSQTLENASLEALYRLNLSIRADARIHLIGCLPAIHGEAAPRAAIDYKIIPRNLSVLNDLIGAKVPIEEVEGHTLPQDEDRVDTFRAAMISLKRGLELVEKAIPFPLPRAFRQFKYLSDHHCYYIKISAGCLGRCSYCAVRRAKGKLLSRDPAHILGDFDHGLKLGYRDFILSADEAGGYGRDRGTTLAELLCQFVERSSDFRMFLRNFDPQWLIADLDRLVALFKSGHFPYLVCPVQSGSPATLKLMDRGYTLEEVEEAFVRLRREIPGMILRTHFIVGFPGESEEEFRRTLAFAKRLYVDHFKVHEFSPRPHTRAALLPNSVQPQVISRRARQLRLLGLRIFARSLFQR